MTGGINQVRFVECCVHDRGQLSATSTLGAWKSRFGAILVTWLITRLASSHVTSIWLLTGVMVAHLSRARRWLGTIPRVLTEQGYSCETKPNGATPEESPCPPGYAYFSFLHSGLTARAYSLVFFPLLLLVHCIRITSLTSRRTG